MSRNLLLMQNKKTHNKNKTNKTCVTITKFFINQYCDQILNVFQKDYNFKPVRIQTKD